MARFTHLTTDQNVRPIFRSGIRAVATSGEIRGVHAMPILPNFFASHQWLRELKRGRAGPLVAIDFVIPDSSGVLVGHYSEAGLEVTATEASRVIRDADDPRGYQVVIPRKIDAREVRKVRNVPQVVGWRYMPDAHGTRPCGCEFCVRGQPGAARLRQRYEDELTD